MNSPSAIDLNSRRTLLRPFVIDDLDQLLELFRNQGIRRFLLDDSLVSRVSVQDEISASTERSSISGTGIYAARLA